VLRRCELELGRFEGGFGEVEFGGEAAVGEGELGQGSGLGRDGRGRGVRSADVRLVRHYYSGSGSSSCRLAKFGKHQVKDSELGAAPTSARSLPT
jgi:hypothetical protein